MDRPTSPSRSRGLRTCLQTGMAGIAGVAVVAGVLAPVAAVAQTTSPSATPSPSPTVTPTTTTSASPTATPSGASATATPTAAITAGTTEDTVVVVRFSEPVQSVDDTTLTILPAVPVVLTIASDARSATLRPTSTWLAGQSYRVTATSGIRDLDGTPLAAASQVFTVTGQVERPGSRSIGYGGAWSARTSSNALGGTFPLPARPPRPAGPAATLAFSGRHASRWSAVSPPASGLAEVWGRRHPSRPRRHLPLLQRLRGDPRPRGSCRWGSHRVQLRGHGEQALGQPGERPCCWTASRGHLT